MKSRTAICWCSAIVALVFAENASALRPFLKRGAFVGHSNIELPAKSWPATSKNSNENGFYDGLVIVRGGEDAPVPVESKKKNSATIGSVIVLAGLLFFYREHWIGLFDKDQLQSKTLEILHSLNALPKYRSYTTYILGMAVWELLGLSTIPVETAAGMVFGWMGFVLSGSGKLLGACIAFGLARHGILANWIQGKLADNSFLQLVQSSAASNPLMTTVLMKMSCFPETIKNYGSSVIKPIRWWMFIFGTMIHGWTFSALWTYLGVDTVLRLEEDSIVPADRLLQSLLTLALINGFVVSPVSMAYWIKSLKDHKEGGK